MGDRLRVAFGVMGNAASLLRYASPISTFLRVISKESTEEFSCIPYIIALLNSALYAWYGLPVVSQGWENWTVVVTSGVGVLLQITFILIFLRFTREKKKVALMTVAVVLVFFITATISAFIFHNHHGRKVFVGIVGLVSSVAMTNSPLVAMKRVIQKKSVEYMPFWLSFSTFLASSLWLAYALLSHDIVLACPNLIGTASGILQLVLYFWYRNKGITGEPHESDTEKNEETSMATEAISDKI